MSDERRVGYTPGRSADVTSRRRKAAQLVGTLSGHTDLLGASILEIGCGNGVITSGLAEAAGPGGTVVGVDVVERLQVAQGFDFRLVTGTDVPFDDGSYDLVVSNHVIEHVGTLEDQRHHLEEIARVLKSDGVGYLATPNRWWPIEPHFGLPLLSWSPHRGLQNRYLRLTSRGEVYDCRLLSSAALGDLLADAHLAWTDLTAEMVQRRFGLRSVSASVIAGTARMARPMVPTFARLLRHNVPSS